MSDIIGIDNILYPLRREPFIGWDDPPRDESEDGHDSHNDWSVCLLVSTQYSRYTEI